MKMFSVKVLGTGTDNRDDYIRAHVKAGDRLSLKLNASHQRDESMVAAFHGDTRIGHIEASARWAREALEEGDQLDCVVEGWDTKSKTLASVNVKLGVVDAALPATLAQSFTQDPIFTRLRDELLAMILIAKSDNRMVRAEREIIIKFAGLRAGDLGLAFDDSTADRLHKWIKRQDPTEPEVLAMIEKIPDTDQDKLHAIYQVTEIVMDMDDKQKTGEFAMLERVQAKIRGRLKG